VRGGSLFLALSLQQLSPRSRRRCTPTLMQIGAHPTLKQQHGLCVESRGFFLKNTPWSRGSEMVSVNVETNPWGSRGARVRESALRAQRLPAPSDPHLLIGAGSQRSDPHLLIGAQCGAWWGARGGGRGGSQAVLEGRRHDRTLHVGRLGQFPAGPDPGHSRWGHSGSCPARKVPGPERACVGRICEGLRETRGAAAMMQGVCAKGWATTYPQTRGDCDEQDKSHRGSREEVSSHEDVSSPDFITEIYLFFRRIFFFLKTSASLLE